MKINKMFLTPIEILIILIIGFTTIGVLFLSINSLNLITK